jgi:16S rRNA (uracil1498-N3)-methyltransferase
MPARRFFVAGTHAAGDTVAIEGSDAHKIRSVLRLRDGDAIEIVDSAATLFAATLRVDAATVSASLGSAAPRERGSRVSVDIAQGLPKGQKMDYVVEKLTELGARAVLPVITQRSVVRDAGDAKVERWRRLARTAAQQCGRTTIPQIAEPVAFEDLLERFSHYDVVLFPWEVADPLPLRDELPGLLAGAASVLAVIGPEGGFSHEEAEAARRAGAHVLSLGPSILRSETAGLALLAVLAYLTV